LRRKECIEEDTTFTIWDHESFEDLFLAILSKFKLRAKQFLVTKFYIKK